MLRYILDRCLTATIVYLIFASLLLQYGNLLPSYLFLGSFALSTIAILLNNANHIQKEFRISSLGSRAPRVRTWTPSNIGFILTAIQYFKQHRNHELWEKNFKWAGEQVGKGKGSSYTHEVVVLGGRLILTADPENIKAILATQFHDFEKGQAFRDDWDQFLGQSSIFTSDGHVWQSARNLLRPQFVKQRVSDLKLFEKHFQQLLPFLKTGSTVRVDDLFFRFTLDAATDFLFGHSVDSLTNADNDFARTFNDVQNTQATIARAGPLKHFVPRRRFNEAIRELRAFTSQFIDQALALSPEELAKSTSDENYNFLYDLATHTRDPSIMHEQLVSLLLAGRDTTACALSWLMYELSRHPDVVSKLRKEIDQHVGLSPDNTPTYQAIKDMRYMSHCINEGLLHASIVPYNVRQAARDTTLPRGGGPDGEQPVVVLKGTQCGFSTFIMQRRPDLFPGEGFRPDRWETQRQTSGYFPFSGGPRLCLGQQFASVEMAYVLTRLLQHFKSIEDRNLGHPGYKTDIVLAPANGVFVALHE